MQNFEDWVTDWDINLTKKEQEVVMQETWRLVSTYRQEILDVMVVSLTRSKRSLIIKSNFCIKGKRLI